MRIRLIFAAWTAILGTASASAEIPRTYEDEEPGYEVYEYAGHEGNYSMRNRLSAARTLEAKDNAEAKKTSGANQAALSHGGE